MAKFFSGLAAIGFLTMVCLATAEELPPGWRWDTCDPGNGDGEVRLVVGPGDQTAHDAESAWRRHNETTEAAKFFQRRGQAAHGAEVARRVYESKRELPPGWRLEYEDPGNGDGEVPVYYGPHDQRVFSTAQVYHAFEDCEYWTLMRTL